MIRFSVIIPTFNNIDYLKLAIKSVKENSNYDHEIILHINEGIDGTLDFAKNEKLIFTHSNNNVGLCTAINLASKKIISVQGVKDGYVRPTIWRGSEMMAISAQQTKTHVAIATWEWGSYFDPKLKIEGIKLNISNWRRPAPNTIPWDQKLRDYI